MIYRKVSPAQFQQLLDWADQNNVDYEVWNPEETLLDESKPIELALQRWPERMPP